MKQRASRRTAAYVGLLAAAFAIALVASWAFGTQLDNAAYDYWFRLYQPKPWPPQSIILDIDEASLVTLGGMRHIRKPLADGLRLVAAARPKAVAVDVILTDEGDPAEDRALTEAFRETPDLALASLFQGDPVRWEDPKPEFARSARAIGHAYAQPDENDSVTRSIPLEMRAGRDRRWALALEAFSLSRGRPITESVSLRSAGGVPSEIQVGDVAIPVKSAGGNILMRVRYLPPGRGVPTVSLQDTLAKPSLAAAFADKVVFAGVTAPSILDRLFTPYALGQTTSGIRIHANAFETMAQRLFLTDVGARFGCCCSAWRWSAAARALRSAICRAGGPTAAARWCWRRRTSHPTSFSPTGAVFSFATPVSVGVVRHPGRGRLLPPGGAPQLAHRAGRARRAISRPCTS